MNQPQFVSFDTKQREILLSQLGNFSPAERELFHKICQVWQREIPYDRFIKSIASSGTVSTGDLHTLMTKLRRERVGLVSTRVADGQRVRHALIVSDPGDAAFYCALADEMFTDMLESITAPLPLESTVVEEFGPVPEEALQRIDARSLAPFMAGNDKESVLLALPTSRQQHILLTSGKLKSFVNLAILKLRYYLGSTNLLGALAKMQDTSLLALKQGCSAKEPGFWLSLTGTIEENTREIESLRTGGADPMFFHVASALKLLISSQMEEAQEKKRFQEEKALDLEAIVMAVKEAPDHFMPPEQLERTIEAQRDKYGERFDEFREEFESRFLKDKEAKTLPHIVQLNKKYIHRDHIYPRFLEEFRYVDAELRPLLVHRMEQNLRSGNRRGDTTFVSLDSFDDAIREEIHNLSQFVADLAQKPAILAEALILHAKQNKLVGSVEELKERLSLYFDPVTMKPLRPHQWFALRLSELFERAFLRLPVWKRLWIRVTGKYEAYKTTYIGRTATTASQQERRPHPSAGEGAQTKPTRSEGRKTGKASGQRTTGSRGASRSAGTGRRGAGEQQKKGYNPKQVESAWEQFGTTLRKKD